MSITTVVFDFGNVLGLFSHRKAAEQLAAYTGASAEAIQAYLFGGQLEDDYEAGRLSTPVLSASIAVRTNTQRVARAARAAGDRRPALMQTAPTGGQRRAGSTAWPRRSATSRS